jgi:hypothetical protein
MGAVPPRRPRTATGQDCPLRWPARWPRCRSLPLQRQQLRGGVWVTSTVSRALMRAFSFIQGRCPAAQDPHNQSGGPGTRTRRPPGER